MTRSLRQHLLRIYIPPLALAAVAALAVPLVPGIDGATAAIATFVIVVGATIATGVALGRYLRTIEHAIEQMTTTAQENARGDLEREVDVDALPSVELRDLGGAINMMSERARGDISEMKRLARVRSEFLGNVSHELRTPIFSVQGYLETLIDGAVDDPSVRDEFLDKAHQNVLRLHTLLTDLIEISRIESGEMKMSFRYFDPAAYFRTVVEELRPTAEMAGIELSYRVLGDGGKTPAALGDRDRLKQVLTNLVENAIKYNRADGSVAVEVVPGANQTVVRVIDTGIGIGANDLQRIFERFYRVDRDRSRRIGGSGLGLAIAKHIIEAHGARILVESTPGAGTTFSFALGR